LVWELVAMAAVFLSSIASSEAQTTSRAPAAANDIVAVRAPMPPVIDSEIGEDEWKGAAVATGFLQFEPRRGDPSGVRTESLVLYDAGHVYVAFRAWDTEPHGAAHPA
jgi:hypothetical protein